MSDKLVPVGVALASATIITSILLFIEWWGCGFVNIATCNFGIA